MINRHDSAFPWINQANNNGSDGMNIRTYLAGLALQGVLANPGEVEIKNLPITAKYCVLAADALIEELNKP